MHVGVERTLKEINVLLIKGVGYCVTPRAEFVSTKVTRHLLKFSKTNHYKALNENIPVLIKFSPNMYWFRYCRKVVRRLTNIKIVYELFINFRLMNECTVCIKKNYTL